MSSAEGRARGQAWWYEGLRLMILFRRMGERCKPRRGAGRILALSLLLAAAGPVLFAQKPPPAPAPGPAYPTPPPPTPPPPYIDAKAPNYDPTTPRTVTFDQVLYRGYLAARLQSMIADSEKLLKLTREINAKIEQSGPDSLTAEDQRKVAEIAKLAGQVKWKMKLCAEAVSGP